jgi:site-specific recombinase XerC
MPGSWESVGHPPEVPVTDEANFRQDSTNRPVFLGAKETALTRFGIYKIIRRYTKHIVKQRADGRPRAVSPHVWRHSTALQFETSSIGRTGVRAGGHPRLH